MTEPRPDRVRVSGPLGAFADGFRADLVEQGYSLVVGAVPFVFACASEPVDGGRAGSVSDALSPGVVRAVRGRASKPAVT